MTQDNLPRWLRRAANTHAATTGDHCPDLETLSDVLYDTDPTRSDEELPRLRPDARIRSGPVPLPTFRTTRTNLQPRRQTDV